MRSISLRSLVEVRIFLVAKGDVFYDQMKLFVYYRESRGVHLIAITELT